MTEHIQPKIKSLSQLFTQPPKTSRGCKAGKSKGKNNKRKVSALAVGWRDSMLAEAIASEARGGEWLLPLCVIYATGCRPEELKTGVVATFDSDKNEFVFVIKGAKVTEKLQRGLEERTVRVKRGGASWEKPLTKMIMKTRSLGAFTVSIKSPSSFSNKVRAASKRLWPTKTVHASPYSFRHQLVSDMKSGGVDEITIAATLGHQSTASQASYGRRKRSGGSKGVEITATTQDEIRTVKSPLERFKQRSTQQKQKSKASTRGLGVRFRF